MVVVFACLVAVAVQAHSQARDATEVLAAARTALGGEARLAAVRTWVGTGRIRQVRGQNLVPVEFEIQFEASQLAINTIAGYSWGFGRSRTTQPPGVAVITGGGVPSIQAVNQDPARYRIQLFVQIQNATNHANYIGYSGTLTSPFFGRPTMVTGTRKVDIGLGLNF